MLRVFTILCLVLLCSSLNLRAQGSKALADAEHYFSVRSYDVALPKFVAAIQAGEKDPMVHYKTAVCYQKSSETDEQIKAIQYFEYALKNGKGMPNSLFYDLGTIYLKDENVQKAIENFNKFKEVSSKADKKAMSQADEAIQTCHNALALMSVPRNFKVTHFNSIINTKYTEYNPVVSADESVMAYTALRPNTGKTRSGDKFIEEIYITYNNSGAWSEPKVIPIAHEYNV
jgi:tetratricopeptide (TPR) repeat protein